MLKSKLVTTTIATSLFTVMLSTGVFAAEATWDVKVISQNDSQYTYTYHFSDGYRIDNTLIEDFYKTIYVPEGSAIQVEYPKNLYTIESFNKYYEYNDLDPSIPELTPYGLGNLDLLINGEWLTDESVLTPNTDPKTLADGRYLTESNKYIVKKGERLRVAGDADENHPDHDASEIYIISVDPTLPKVDASKFVLTPGIKAPSTSKTTTTSTNKTTTTKVTTPAYTVKVNGKASTATPIVQKGVSFVPARDFVEKSLGGKVDYNAKKGTLTVYANKKVVTFTEGSSDYYVDGVKKSLPANSKLVRKNNTLYVPVKPVCQSLGFSVGYDKDSNAIVVK